MLISFHPSLQVMAGVENAMVEALDRQFADVLSPLKDNLATLGLKYVQKLAKRTDGFYLVPAEVSANLTHPSTSLHCLSEMEHLLWVQLTNTLYYFPAGSSIEFLEKNA